MKRQCIDCEFVAAMRGVYGEYLECRRNPPQHGSPKHPTVAPTHWCGAYEWAGNVYDRMAQESELDGGTDQ